MAPNLAALSVAELLALHSGVAAQLRLRGIARTSNNPTGDLAEYLFCAAFGWARTANSMKAIDAVCPAGLRYQIKGRRLTPTAKSRQLGAIRNIDGGHFDFLAGVLFDEGYKVHRAALIPAEVVCTGARYVAATNSSKFMLRDGVWDKPGVRDVTAELRAVMP